MSVYEKNNIDNTQVKSHALAILVENQVGALARVVSMFSARGYNIDSLTVAKVTEDETISRIKDVLDTKIRPAVARDGGDIKFKSFDNGVVRVELQGACSGCPSSIMTLKQGVQNLLKHYVKEVNSVEAI